jgi:hypothetical protein
MRQLACMQDSDADDFSMLVPDQNVVVRQLGVVGMARFLEVQVQHVGLRVVTGPDGLKWYACQLWRQIDDALQIQVGHILLR